MQMQKKGGNNMLNNEWNKLQNGSDIRGIALEGIANEVVNLTPNICTRISKFFAVWLSEKTQKPISSLKISVGNDSRLSGPMLREAVINGMSDLGVTVYNCGLASTPAMFMSTVLEGFKYDGAIMVTASHLPFNRNGLKFFTEQGGLEKEDIKTILEKAQNMNFAVPDIKGKILTVDLISAYSNYLVSKIREGSRSESPLNGLKIIVDAGNGAGGFFTEKVLKPLGADTDGSQFLDPDGSFPNHISNPEDEEAMTYIKEAVLNNKADFGIIFDTDVDRAGAVDRNGKEINKNRIVALMASIVLEEHPCSIIVTDSITSTELKAFIEEKLKGVHHRFKRGYKNVINESLRLNKEGKESYLAIETSGHGALKENYFLDDGAYLIAKILIKIARLKKENQTIDMLLNELKEPLETKEFRMNILESDFKSYGETIISILATYATKKSEWLVEPDNYEGIKINFDDKNGNGWFLLRLSLHDPLMPLNIESNMEGGVKVIGKKLLEFLDAFEGLDTSSLKSYCM